MTLGDFTEQATAYGRSRPSYPPGLFRRLLDLASVRREDPVAEIGAGTGVFTRLLSEAELRVTAIEPNRAMQDVAPKLERVTWRRGTFEETGLGSSSQRWVIAAQAFHWADVPPALAEIDRVLLPGSHFTVLWNCREYDKSEVLGRTLDLIERHVPDFDPVYRLTDWGPVLESTGVFANVKRLEEENVVGMTRERYLTLWQGHHRLNHFAGKERFGRFFAELAALVEGQSDDILEIPYVCKAWTAVSRGSVG